ncbi:MAG: glycosyltransferase family 61 protein [Alphaproteobacteria bacterium]
MKRVYTDQEFIEKNKEKYSKKYFKKEKAAVKTIENGYILPPQKHHDNMNSFYKGGVVDSKGKFVPLSSHLRESPEGALQDGYAFEKNHVKYENKKVIFGGFFISFFGHFLVETSSRLWYWLEHKEENLEIIFIEGKSKKTAPQVWEFLDLLGVPRNKVRILKEITQFKEIIVPTQSTVISTSYNDKFTEIFQNIAQKIEPKNFEKVYLSRTKFKKGTPCFGEEIIEKTFKDNGYKIIYPERLSLKEQISYLNNAKEIAGLAGTALHLVLFAKPKTKVIALDRSDYVIEEQILINQAKEIDDYYVAANANPVPTDHSEGPLLITLTDHLASFFNDHNFKYNTQDIGFIKKKYLKYFIKTYYKTYVKTSKNNTLRKIDNIVAKRIKLYFQELRKPFWKL